MNSRAQGFKRFANICAATLLFFGVASPSYAEQDYEFVKLMLERDEPSFSTEDLIQQLIVKLEADPSAKSEVALIKATVKRRQAMAATAEKADKLLKEVEELYNSIQTSDPKFKHLQVINDDKKLLLNLHIKVEKDAANLLRASDPNKARAICHDLALRMAAIAADRKAIADKAEEAFKPAYKKFVDWRAKNDPDEEGKPIPPDILNPLIKSFDAWILADNSYVAAKMEQVECYDDSDPDKKPQAEELAKYCEAKIPLEALANFPAITSWYNYILGRVYSSVQNADKATEAWQAVVGVELTGLHEDQRKQLFNLKKLIIADLVKMKMKAGKYNDVESIIIDAMMDGGLKMLFEEDAGKELQIDYAKALTKQPESDESSYEKAIKKLGELVQKEKSKGADTMWSNKFAYAMSELFEASRTAKLKLRLGMEEWYEIAHGFYLKGRYEHKIYKEFEKDSPNEKVKIKNQFEKMYVEYRNAVDCYQQIINMARSEGADLAMRLDMEAKAWFEMSIAYQQMKHNYESVAVCQALRGAFLPNNRKKWLPNPKSAEGQKFYTKSVNASLEELDKTLGNVGTVIMSALDQNAATHRHSKDFWNRKFKGMILSDNEDAPIASGKEIKSLAYIRAKTDMDEAKGLAEAARSDSDPKTQEDSFQRAFDKWVSAGDKFAKIKTNEEGYEPAIYQAGQAYTLAQALLTTNKLPSKKPADVEKLAKDLCDKALDSYQKYMDFVAKTPAVEEEDKALRANLQGAVFLARNTLYIGAKEWDKAIKSADDYVAWEQQLPQAPTTSSIGAALLNKFRALIILTGPPNSAPKCDPFLQEAEKVMNELVKINPKDKKLYLYLLSSLSDRNNIAAFQMAKFIKEGSQPFGAEDIYENKVAELQEKRVDMIEEEPDREPALEDYCRLVYLFNKTAKYKKAVMVARKLLEKFDPQNKNVRITEDDPQVWQSLLARMKGDLATNMSGVLHYDDFNKDERCKKEHMILIDYLYDTREGRAAGDELRRRPAFDQYNMDMERAIKQIERIYKEFPDCQTLPDPKTKKIPDNAIKALNDWIDSWKDKYPELQALKPKPGEPKALLNFIEEEVDFRRKIEATRDLLSSLALEQGEKLAKEGKEDKAKELRELAGEQIKILGKLRGDTPQMQIKTAEIDISVGKLDSALGILFNIKTTIDRDKDYAIYFDASRKIAEIYARQKKWHEAAEFPEYLAITVGFKSRLIKERWPQLKDFLKNCYANGAPCHPKLAADIKADDNKSEEKKPDAIKGEPKVEEVKKETGNTEEKKL